MPTLLYQHSYKLRTHLGVASGVAVHFTHIVFLCVRHFRRDLLETLRGELVKRQITAVRFPLTQYGLQVGVVDRLFLDHPLDVLGCIDARLFDVGFQRSHVHR